VRFGLVGTGHWARTVHAARLSASEDVELVGVWGRDADRTSALADSVGVRAYEDADAMFASVEAVAFAVPPDVQAPLAAAAAHHGCHVLLEKPTALDVDAASTVVDAVTDAGVASVVYVTPRFAPPVAAWLEEVRATGGWWGAQATWLAAAFRDGSPYATSTWRRERGALWDVGPHVLSVLLAALGPVDDLVAAAGRGDTTHLVARHTDGASSTSAVSLTVPEAAARRELTLYGEGGWTSMPDLGPDPHATAYPAALTALLDSARTGEPHPCDARFGLEIVELLARAEGGAGGTGRHLS
jgi:predicted dehydrogenase